MNAFRDILAIPFGWAMSLFYSLSENYLLTLVLITLVIRLLLLPTSIKQQKNSAKQMRLQAKVNKIRAKYAGNNSREAQMKISEETQELYKREGFSASQMGCSTMIIQLLVMMGLYGAIYSPISNVLRYSDTILEALKNAYGAFAGADALKDTYRLELNILNKFGDIRPFVDLNIVSNETLDKIQNFIDNFSIFGIDLTALPSEFKTLGFAIILIPILAGATAMCTSIYSYIKQRKANPEMAKNPAMGCMTFMSPLISVVFAYTLPAGIGFYWIISNIFSFIQTVGLSIALKPDKIIAQQMIDETVKRRSREQSVKIRAAFTGKQNKE